MRISPLAIKKHPYCPSGKIQQFVCPYIVSGLIEGKEKKQKDEQRPTEGTSAGGDDDEDFAETESEGKGKQL